MELLRLGRRRIAKLYDKATGRYLGSVTDRDLQFLIDNLEEESVTDVDYWIDRATLDLLRKEDMSEPLAEMIETAMGPENEIEIRYERSGL